VRPFGAKIENLFYRNWYFDVDDFLVTRIDCLYLSKFLLTRLKSFVESLFLLYLRFWNWLWSSFDVSMRSYNFGKFATRWRWRQQQLLSLSLFSLLLRFFFVGTSFFWNLKSHIVNQMWCVKEIFVFRRNKIDNQPFLVARLLAVIQIHIHNDTIIKTIIINTTSTSDTKFNITSNGTRPRTWTVFGTKNSTIASLVINLSSKQFIRMQSFTRKTTTNNPLMSFFITIYAKKGGSHFVICHSLWSFLSRIDGLIFLI